MNTRSTRQGSRSTGMTKLVLVLMLFALLAIPSAAMADQPMHAVRGHGIYNLTPPSAIDQISINATVDANGAALGTVVWLANYLAPPEQPAPDWVGWIWKIDVTSLSVTGNVATIGGTVVADNRFPVNIGCQVGFIVTDNGSGAASPNVLELVDSPGCVIGGPNSRSGGNFTVKWAAAQRNRSTFQGLAAAANFPGILRTAGAFRGPKYHTSGAEDCCRRTNTAAPNRNLTSRGTSPHSLQPSPDRSSLRTRSGLDKTQRPL